MVMYFTFGQTHTHSLDGFTYDKDVVVEMVSPYPRDAMMELFGDRWAMQYENKPDLSYFPRGIKQIVYVPKREGNYGEGSFKVKPVPEIISNNRRGGEDREDRPK